MESEWRTWDDSEVRKADIKTAAENCVLLHFRRSQDDIIDLGVQENPKKEMKMSSRDSKGLSENEVYDLTIQKGLIFIEILVKGERKERRRRRKKRI